MSDSATSNARRPVVAVTATTEMIRGLPRVRVNVAYTRALEAAGLMPLVVPPLDDPAGAAAIIAAVDGLVLTGGEDIGPESYGEQPHPTVTDVNADRDRTELALLREAQRTKLPTLAICRGIQLLNVALGGTLMQDIPSAGLDGKLHNPGGARSDRTHEISIEPDSTLARAIGADRVTVNSSHHQAVGKIGDGLRVTAKAPDGVIEAMETTQPDWWAVAVQWHPEELTETEESWDRSLYAAFARVVSESTR